MYKRRSFNVLLAGIVTLSVIVLFALIYAAFTQQLTISGDTTARKSKWDIHFQNLSNISTYQTAKVLSQPNIKNNDTTTIENYSVSVTSPGDYITFTFNVINNGNYDARITSVSLSTPSCTGTDSTSNTNVCNHIHYYLIYDTGATVQTNDVILAKETQTMQVKLEYDNTVTASELPEEDVSISNLDITINYEQNTPAYVKDNGEVEESYAFYRIGDKITLNNEDYHIIAKSGVGQDYVVALKDEPLTVAEVNLYGGVGTENNHVNKYTDGSIGTSKNSNGYGAIAYYTSETCGLVNGSYNTSECIMEYRLSDIKYVIDAWSEANFTNNELKEVNGYKARLITADEYSSIPTINSWRYSSRYYYWTMTPLPSYNNRRVSIVSESGAISPRADVTYYSGVVRPVINVYKSAIATE